jgi:hypothetical protein
MSLLALVDTTALAAVFDGEGVAKENFGILANWEAR